MNFRFYAALIGNAGRLGPLTVPLEADTVSAFRRRLLMPGTLPWDAGWTNVPYHPSWGLETPGHCKVPPLPRGAGGPSRPWPTGLTESHASPLPPPPRRQLTAWAPAARGPISES